MFFAKTPRGLKESIVQGAIDGLTLEQLEAIVDKKRKELLAKEAKRNDR